MNNQVIIGNAELYHGDCMDYMATQPDNAFDLADVDETNKHEEAVK